MGLSRSLPIDERRGLGTKKDLDVVGDFQESRLIMLMSQHTTRLSKTTHQLAYQVPLQVAMPLAHRTRRVIITKMP